MQSVENSALYQARVYAQKHFPGRKVDAQAMGEALFLEKDFWRKMDIAVANGVTHAFKG
ncbi:MAG: hypothetical protein OCC45_10515 [Desulfotalea sp.]